MPFIDRFDIINGGKLLTPLSYILKALKISSMWIDSGILYQIYHYWLSIMTWTCVFLKVYNFRYIYNDLILLSSTLYIVASEICSLTKTRIVVRKHRIIKTILNELDQDDFQPKTQQERHQLQQFINVWKSISLIYAGSVLGAVILMALFPMFDKSEERRLPFVSWFPYDSLQSPYYQLTYIYQIFVINTEGFLTTIVDIFVSSIIAIIAGQFSILCLRLRNIREITEDRLMQNGTISNDSQDRETRILEEMNETLKECILYHQKILNFTKTAELITDPVAITQLVTTVLVLCTTTFELTLVPINSSEFVSLVFYQSSLIFEIILYCWFGDQVLHESGQIRMAIYESDWVCTPLTFKKNMLFLIRRTQEPLQLRALGFFVLSLPTFSGVIRLSWSYFVVLRQTQNMEH